MASNLSSRKNPSTSPSASFDEMVLQMSLERTASSNLPTSGNNNNITRSLHSSTSVSNNNNNNNNNSDRLIRGSASSRAAPLPLPLRLAPRSNGNGRSSLYNNTKHNINNAASPLSPIFVRLCILCVTSILCMACSFALCSKSSSALQKELQHHQLTNRQFALRKQRQLRDYFLENGVDEPIYVPAPIEHYLVQHANELGYNTAQGEKVEGCKVWNSPQEAPQIYGDLHAHLQELDRYNEALNNYTMPTSFFGNSTDVRDKLTGDGEEADYNTCQHLELGNALVDSSKRKKEKIRGSSSATEDLKQAYFKSGQLSHTIKCGWVEPLLTPMRNPKFCTQGKKGNYLNLDYLVHDYAAMCRRLKPTSRIVLFDLGASSKFAGVSSPSLKLLQRFHQFGLKVDHIHAFEIKPLGKNAKEEMYRLAPRQLQAAHDLQVAYHWVTGGVSTEPEHAQNPLTILQQEYNDDDLILMKLDIDIPEMEIKYVKQILNTPALLKMIDQFYFEHHVHLQEMTAAWKTNMGGSVKDTLEVFTQLREKGVPAHYWV